MTASRSTRQTTYPARFSFKTKGGNRINPRRRRALAKRLNQAWDQPKEDIWNVQPPNPLPENNLWNAPQQQDWEPEATNYHHCERCHLAYEGHLHWDCYLFPALDDTTCPVCNSNPPELASTYPLTVLAHSSCLAPLNNALVIVRNYYLNYDYLPLWKRSIHQFLLYSLAYILAKTL